MKILKSLNKKIFSTQLICLIFFIPVFAEEKPIDIWNIEKKDNQVILETNISSENTVNTPQNGVYELQTKKQTQPPYGKDKRTKAYRNAVLTFAKNKAKWNAAENYCDDRQMKFLILTEDHLAV